MTRPLKPGQLRVWTGAGPAYVDDRVFMLVERCDAFGISTWVISPFPRWVSPRSTHVYELTILRDSEELL